MRRLFALIVLFACIVSSLPMAQAAGDSQHVTPGRDQWLRDQWGRDDVAAGRRVDVAGGAVGAAGKADLVRRGMGILLRC